MFDGEDIAFNGLEVCSYRHLQGLAKSLALPSNVKKVHLIEMIRAKKYCSETDLKVIVDRVKMERKVNAQIKKKKQKRKPFRLQGTEISSTSASQSPPISLTPKRSSNFMVHYSPDMTQTIMKYQPRPNILRPGTSILQPLRRGNESDRVLRSFNSMKRPNYRIMEQNNCLVEMIKGQNSVQEIRQERIQEIHQERAYHSVNVTIQKHRPIMNTVILNRDKQLNAVHLNGDRQLNTVVLNRDRQLNTVVLNRDRQLNTVVLNRDRQLMPVSRSSNIPQPAKRQRKLSGIYPIQPPDKPYYKYVPSVGFRQTDGRVTKINAVIQRPLANTLLPKKHALVPKNHALATKKPIVVTIQDVINYKVDHPSDDLTRKRAIEASSSRLSQEIDQSNEVDRQIYQSQSNETDLPMFDDQSTQINEIDRTSERQFNEAREINQQIYDRQSCQSKENIQQIYQRQLHQSRENDRRMCVNQSKAAAREIEVSSNCQVDSQTLSRRAHEPIYSIADTRDPNLSRKVYKNRQTTKSDRRGWNYNVDYQENDTDTRREWSIYDIEGQLLDKTDAREEMNDSRNAYKIQCFSHRVKDTNEPISTNYKVKQGRITEPIARDNPNENPRYNQSMAKKNIGPTKNIDHARNIEHSRNMDYARNIEHSRDMDYARNIENSRDMDYAARNIEHARNMEIARNNDFDRNMDHARNIDHSRNMDYAARNVDHARNMDHARNIDASSQYPNMAASADVFQDDCSQEPMDIDFNTSMYYHKKIRAERVRTKGRDSERLPKINDAFSKFNDVHFSLSQPLYVKVCTESERVPILNVNSINSTCMLESIYNFKNRFITNPQVLQIATTETTCTYSTMTVSTAVAQPAAADFSNNINPYARDNPYQCYEQDHMPRFYDYLNPEDRGRTNFGCDEVLSSSTASLETTNSQELNANVSIPAIVEDALELISQDGDYMERIGMDVRVQCIVCDWAGPKIILEYHIKKEHPNAIQQQDGKEWSVLFTLGELISKQTWSSQLLQHNDNVYAISAKYNHNDTLMISLSIISYESETEKRGQITVYNRISGKPYTFEGEIKNIPVSMPYEFGEECLELDIGDLDLIPNSANLRLVNRELVGSPSKVIVGQPELNSLEIVVYAKLLN